MIVNYEYNDGYLKLSYIDPKGKIKLKYYNWKNPLEWNICSDSDTHKSDKFKTWDNKPVKLDSVRYPNRYTVYEYLKKLPQQEQDDIFSYQDPKMYFCDIEVEITDGFPEAHIAANKVTAICLIRNNKVLLLGIKDVKPESISKMENEMNKYFEKFETSYKIEWVYYETEYEMLKFFFDELIQEIPVLTGWNFVGYDWVYLVTRARKLGLSPENSSPTKKLVKPWKKVDPTNFKQTTYEELPKHRLVFDYMDIFDKWDMSIKIKESSTLDFISSQVLGVKKLEYKGTLKDLYHNDWYAYLLYNCIDTALVQLIHQKQRTFDIMLSMSHLAKIQIADSLSAIRVTEGLFFDKFYNDGIVMCRKNNTLFSDHTEDEVDADEELGGGYVKFPSTGLKRWISVFDFASLYPTTMRMYNIGPDSFKGMKINDSEALLNGIRYPILKDDIVLLNGAVFKNNESQTKQILTSVFKDRKTNKNLALDYKKQEQLIKNYLKLRNAK